VLEAIAAFATPRTKKQVRSFLGKTGYYRSLVPEYSVLAGPLEEVTGKKEFQWGPTNKNPLGIAACFGQGRCRGFLLGFEGDRDLY